MHLSNWVKLATMDKLANTVKDECIENSKYMDQQVLRCGHGDYSLHFVGQRLSSFKDNLPRAADRYRGCFRPDADRGSSLFIGRFDIGFLQKFVFRKSVAIPTRGFMPLLWLGLAQTGLQYFFFYNGVANSTGIKSAILNSVGNFLVVIFAHFIYPDDKLNTGKVFGLVTGFAGIILVNWQAGAGGFSWDFSFIGEGF